MNTQQLSIEVIKQHAIRCHANTNQMYDTYLPYEFHLRMVVKVAEQFKNLLITGDYEQVIAACWCHDLIEDCRQTYNDVKQVSDEYVADIVRAVTNNGRGRNRAERMPDEIYAEIKSSRLATYVKLCDRIANVEYSKMTGSCMFEMYKKEHDHFYKMIGDNVLFMPMWRYLYSLIHSDYLTTPTP